jgi:predicted transcriptional regulator
MARLAPHGLGPLQAEVMEIAWERGEVTVTQVMDVIAARRSVTYTTILVAMQKLAKSGWLKHRSEGRAYVYSPSRTRQREILERKEKRRE